MNTSWGVYLKTGGFLLFGFQKQFHEKMRGEIFYWLFFKQQGVFLFLSPSPCNERAGNYDNTNENYQNGKI